jgi:hypothetical protein
VAGQSVGRPACNGQWLNGLQSERCQRQFLERQEAATTPTRHLLLSTSESMRAAFEGQQRKLISLLIIAWVLQKNRNLAKRALDLLGGLYPKTAKQAGKIQSGNLKQKGTKTRLRTNNKYDGKWTKAPDRISLKAQKRLGRKDNFLQNRPESSRPGRIGPQSSFI